jgi:MotA/TolQ/ExbB proton channel family
LLCALFVPVHHSFLFHVFDAHFARSMNPLNSHTSDIEARLGFQSGKFTNPNKLFCLLLGACFTCSFFGFLFVLPDAWRSSRFVAIFLDRGYIPYVTMLAFFWGLALLWVKHSKLATQKQALPLVIGKMPANLSPSSAGLALTWLQGLSTTPHDFILLNRLQLAFQSLSKMRQPADIPNVVSHAAALDEAQFDNSYSLISAILYAVPVLGFIGTVVGLGEAIGGFGQTLTASANTSSLIDSLTGVTGGLSVAFDTTFVALVAALTLQLISTLVQSKETLFLEDCNFFFQQEVYPNLCSDPA